MYYINIATKLPWYVGTSDQLFGKFTQPWGQAMMPPVTIIALRRPPRYMGEGPNSALCTATAKK